MTSSSQQALAVYSGCQLSDLTDQEGDLLGRGGEGPPLGLFGAVVLASTRWDRSGELVADSERKLAVSVPSMGVSVTKVVAQPEDSTAWHDVTIKIEMGRPKVEGPPDSR